MSENNTNVHISHIVSTVSAEEGKGGPGNSNLIYKVNVREELTKMFTDLIKGKKDNNE